MFRSGSLRDKTLDDLEGRVDELRTELKGQGTLRTGYRLMNRRLLANWRAADHEAGQRLLVPLDTINSIYEGVLNTDLIKAGYLDSLDLSSREKAIGCLASLAAMTYTETFYGDYYERVLMSARREIVLNRPPLTVAEVIIVKLVRSK